MSDKLDEIEYLPERCATCDRVYTTFTCDHESGISPEDEAETDYIDARMQRQVQP